MSLPPQPINILIAEDHEIVRDGLCAIVNQQNDFQVIAEARDGQEAVELYRDRQPDVVLMDLRMPRMEGVEAITQIISEFQQAKIVILTTYDTDEDIYRGLKAGAKGYLLKDTSAEDLAEVIRIVASGKNYLPQAIVSKLTQRINNRDELTARELEVLQLLCKGKSNQDISSILQITEGTVKYHVNNILNKLQVRDRTQAVITAFKKGLARLE